MHYVIEGNEYVLMDEFDRVHWRGEEIAVALEYQPTEEISGTLMKYGPPDAVQAWVDKTRQKLLAGGLVEMASQLVVVKGKIPIEELSKIIDITGYVGRWYQRISMEVNHNADH